MSDLRVSVVMPAFNEADILATSVTAPATVALDQTFNVTVTVMNQGDAVMPASTGKMYLTVFDRVNPSTDFQIAAFSVPALAIDASATIVVPCTISSSLGSLGGTWTIGPALDRTLVATEHSEANNLNPFLAGFHGNARVTFQ